MGDALAVPCPTCLGAGTSTYICLMCDGAGKVPSPSAVSPCPICGSRCSIVCEYCNAPCCKSAACARLHASACSGHQAAVFHDEVHARDIHYRFLKARPA